MEGGMYSLGQERLAYFVVDSVYKSFAIPLTLQVQLFKNSLQIQKKIHPAKTFIKELLKNQTIYEGRGKFQFIF